MNVFVFVLGVITLVFAYRLADRAICHRRESEPSETQMIQDINRGLQRMEQRIEALETIVIEKYSGEPFEHADR
jgi:hypothetical protein